jgi:hypothetical protein
MATAARAMTAAVIARVLGPSGPASISCGPWSQSCGPWSRRAGGRSRWRNWRSIKPRILLPVPDADDEEQQHRIPAVLAAVEAYDAAAKAAVG